MISPMDTSPRQLKMGRPLIKPEEFRDLETIFPFLAQIPEDVRHKLYAVGRMTTLPAGKVMLQAGRPCTFIPLVVKGSIRVFNPPEHGRTMTLFRIRQGQTCVVSLLSQLREKNMPVMAETETPVRIYMLPFPSVCDCLEQQLAWKDFMVRIMMHHLTDVIHVLEATLFERKDRQLINWLNEQLKGKPGTLICTHEQIAIDIGSVREVVSRMLEDLQKKGLVTLSRGKIRVKDQALFDVNKTRN